MAESGEQVLNELERAKALNLQYEANLAEVEALVGFLRERTGALNAEVRNRDRLIADRDRAIVSLSEQLEGNHEQHA